MDSTCHDGVCSKCWAGKFIIFGLVLFASTWYAKATSNVYFIWYVLALLLVLKGIMKLTMPSCGHCKGEMKKGRK